MGNKEYKSAFKATGLLGGVNLVVMLISALQSKIIVLLIGPSGYGLMSLFSTTISLIGTSTNLGLSSSAIRDIAKAYGENNKKRLTQKIIAIRRCVFLTGVLGALVTIFLSPYLSVWTFKSKDYIWSFVLLSMAVCGASLNGGNGAVILGCRRLVYLSKSKIGSALTGLLLAIVIFFFFKEKGIIFYFIVTTFFSVGISFYFFLKIRNAEMLVNESQSLKQSLYEGYDSMKLGIMMSLSAAVALLTEYIVKAYIMRCGGAVYVGLYQAAWSINTVYLGVIFNAMSTDYYPRLSLISADNNKVTECVNQQSEIALLLLGPLIVLMIIFIHPLILIFYSEKFLPMVSMAQLLLIGTFVKAGSWAIGYIYLAKGDGKTYLINELGLQLFILPSYLVAFTYGGLESRGIVFIANQLLYFVWVSFIAKRKYDYRNSMSFWKMCVVMLIIILVCLFIDRAAIQFNMIAQAILSIILLVYSIAVPLKSKRVL